MRIHLFAGVIAIVLAWFLKIDRLEWCLIFLCIFLVIASEMMNSALEYSVDLVTSEQQELARKAKDAAAGTVLVFAILSLILAAFIFIPKLLLFFE